MGNYPDTYKAKGKVVKSIKYKGVDIEVVEAKGHFYYNVNGLETGYTNDPEQALTAAKKEVDNMVGKESSHEQQPKAGDKCWNCDKIIKDPKNHYPINATAFCKDEKESYKEKLSSMTEAAPASADQVMSKAKAFIDKLISKWQMEKNYVIEKKSDSKIEIRTDGDVYDFIYDPESCDLEWISSARKTNEEFHKLIQSMGWSVELYGGGILTLFNDSNQEKMKEATGFGVYYNGSLQQSFSKKDDAEKYIKKQLDDPNADKKKFAMLPIEYEDRKKESNGKKDYKVFDTSTEQGMKDAEKHQQALYKKYDKVKVEPSGLDKTAVWGESSGWGKMPDFEKEDEPRPTKCAKCSAPLNHNYNIDLCKKCLSGKAKEKKKERFTEMDKSKVKELQSKSRKIMNAEPDTEDDNLYKKQVKSLVGGKLSYVYYHIFEDANFHKLNRTLEELGMFTGTYADTEDEYNDYKKSGGKTWNSEAYKEKLSKLKESFKESDQEIAKALTSERPPTNKQLLQRWKNETSNEDLKSAIDEWTDVLDKKKNLMDLDIYDKVNKIAKESYKESSESNYDKIKAEYSDELNKIINGNFSGLHVSNLFNALAKKAIPGLTDGDVNRMMDLLQDDIRAAKNKKESFESDFKGTISKVVSDLAYYIVKQKMSGPDAAKKVRDELMSQTGVPQSVATQITNLAAAIYMDDKEKISKYSADLMKVAQRDMKEGVLGTLKLVRPAYGKPDTPEKDREYKATSGGPVGTRKEWEDWAKKQGYDELEFEDKISNKNFKIKLKEEYNGWTNWDTWSVFTWMTDDEASGLKGAELVRKHDKAGFIALAKRVVKDKVDFKIVNWDEAMKGVGEAYAPTNKERHKEGASYTSAKVNGLNLRKIYDAVIGGEVEEANDEKWFSQKPPFSMVDDIEVGDRGSSAIMLKDGTVVKVAKTIPDDKIDKYRMESYKEGTMDNYITQAEEYLKKYPNLSLKQLEDKIFSDLNPLEAAGVFDMVRRKKKESYKEKLSELCKKESTPDEIEQLADDCMTEIDKLGDQAFQGSIQEIIDKFRKKGLSGEGLKDVKDYVKKNFGGWKESGADDGGEENERMAQHFFKKPYAQLSEDDQRYVRAQIRSIKRHFQPTEAVKDYSKVDYTKYAFLKSCPKCGGAGKFKPLNSGKETECPDCEGTGYKRIKKEAKMLVDLDADGMAAQMKKPYGGLKVGDVVKVSSEEPLYFDIGNSRPDVQGWEGKVTKLMGDNHKVELTTAKGKFVIPVGLLNATTIPARESYKEKLSKMTESSEPCELCGKKSDRLRSVSVGPYAGKKLCPGCMRKILGA